MTILLFFFQFQKLGFHKLFNKFCFFYFNSIPRIPTPIPRIPTLIPHVHTPIPCILTLILRISTPFLTFSTFLAFPSGFTTFPPLFPAFPTLSLDSHLHSSHSPHSVPRSPFRLLQIAFCAHSL